MPVSVVRTALCTLSPTGRFHQYAPVWVPQWRRSGCLNPPVSTGWYSIFWVAMLLWYYHQAVACWDGHQPLLTFDVRCSYLMQRGSHRGSNHLQDRVSLDREQKDTLACNNTSNTNQFLYSALSQPEGCLKALHSFIHTSAHWGVYSRCCELPRSELIIHINHLCPHRYTYFYL